MHPSTHSFLKMLRHSAIDSSILRTISVLLGSSLQSNMEHAAEEVPFFFSDCIHRQVCNRHSHVIPGQLVGGFVLDNCDGPQN